MRTIQAKNITTSRLKIMRLACLFLALLCFPALANSVLQKSERSGAKVQVHFQYMLSNLSGVVPSQWARLAYDNHRKELYTLNQSGNEVTIFNQQGMEVFAFGNEFGVVAAVDVAVDESGDIYLLSRSSEINAIQVLNYRGEPRAVIHLQGLPDDLKDFRADRLEYHQRQLYLLNSGNLRIVVVSTEGRFVKEYDLKSRLEKQAAERDRGKSKKTTGLDISGFSIGVDNSIYLTVPLMFSVMKINPDDSLSSFGMPGSAPGQFGVLSGISSDTAGNIFVADRLRSVVMVFKPDFTFLGEFGYRGDRPEDMIVPDDLALDRDEGVIYVSQAANKGVGVYKVTLGSPLTPSIQ